MEFAQQLKACFNNALPGSEAQMLMAPQYRRNEIPTPETLQSANKSSVLILFFKKSDEYYIPFIQRPFYNGVHSGQIAFPGGRWESTDKSMYHTALREAHEEIGIHTQNVSFCGKLTDLYIPPSNHIVSPFVGLYQPRGSFLPDKNEVDAILEIPFSFFLSASSVKTTTLKITNGLTIETPCFVYEKNVIWGATAMMMNELIILWKTTVKYR